MAAGPSRVVLCMICKEAVDEDDETCLEVGEQTVHSGCARCAQCGFELNEITIQERDGKLYCVLHVPIFVSTPRVPHNFLADLEAIEELEKTLEADIATLDGSAEALPRSESRDVSTRSESMDTAKQPSDSARASTATVALGSVDGASTFSLDSGSPLPFVASTTTPAGGPSSTDNVPLSARLSRRLSDRGVARAARPRIAAVNNSRAELPLAVQVHATRRASRAERRESSIDASAAASLGHVSSADDASVLLRRVERDTMRLDLPEGDALFSDSSEDESALAPVPGAARRSVFIRAGSQSVPATPHAPAGADAGRMLGSPAGAAAGAATTGAVVNANAGGLMLPRKDTLPVSRKRSGSRQLLNLAASRSAENLDRFAFYDGRGAAASDTTSTPFATEDALFAEIDDQAPPLQRQAAVSAEAAAAPASAAGAGAGAGAGASAGAGAGAGTAAPASSMAASTTGTPTSSLGKGDEKRSSGSTAAFAVAGIGGTIAIATAASVAAVTASAEADGDTLDDDDDAEECAPEETSENGDIIFVRMDRRKTVKAGRPGKLVTWLTNERTPDPEYMQTFMLTYRSFLQPEQLLSMLRERFVESPEPGLTEAETHARMLAVRIRLCNVLKVWMESYATDFATQPALLDQLEAFVNETVYVTMPSLAERLRSHASKLRAGLALGRTFTGGGMPPAPILPRTFRGDLTARSTSVLFSELDPLEFARQLTLAESRIFQSIQPFECLKKAWSRGAAEAPNIIALAQRFNVVSRLVASTVLQEGGSSAKKRAATMKWWLTCAGQCAKLANYNGVMEIISGLHSSAIFRLKKTWEALPRSASQLHKRLSDLIHRDGNYRAMRAVLKYQEPPCLPYLGVFLTDLTFIEDGMPDELVGGLVNFTKLRFISVVIKGIQSFQITPYCLINVPGIQDWIMNFDGISEPDQYKMSLEYEPRQKTAA